MKSSALELLEKHSPLGEVLCFSYPDFLMDVKDSPVSKASGRGKKTGLGFETPDATELLKHYGATSVRYIDTFENCGHEDVMDPSYPLSIGPYDFVIDAGMSRHCFNAAQFLMNCAHATKMFGKVLHYVPVTMVNVGFWNFSPTVLWDFYDQNGFGVDEFWWESNDQVGPAQAFKVKPVPSGVSLYCVAQKLTENVLRYPTQTRMKNMEPEPVVIIV